MKWKKDKADRGVYQRGKVWYIRYADQTGVVRAERVGPAKSLALKVYAKRKTEVAERRFFPTMGILWDELIEDVLVKERKRHKLRRRSEPFKPGPKAIVLRWFTGRRADSITPEEIEKKLADAKTPSTHNKWFYAMNKTFRVAIKHRKLTVNPMTALNAEHNDVEHIRYLNQYQLDEEQRLRAAIQKLCADRECELDLALNTGLRWREQYTLTWRNVDLVRKQITLPRTKSGKEQYVPINGSAQAALTRLRELHPESELVCPGGAYYNEFKRKFWNPVVKLAKTDLLWHDLRHTFASRLVMKGVDIYTVSKLLRHGDVKTTQRYVHLSTPHLAAAVERLGEPGVTPGVQADKASSYLQ